MLAILRRNTSSLCLAGGGFTSGDLDADAGFAPRHVCAN
jgi:hypothetical protein